MYVRDSQCLDQHESFSSTWVGRLLRAEPVRVIDVGARDGFHPIFRRLGKLCDVLGFEPDAAAYASLEQDRSFATPFNAVKIEPVALGAGGTQQFFCYSNPNNNSLLPPNLTITSRYAMKMFELRSAYDIETHRLDDVIFSPNKDLSDFGEFIKLDTQGSEQIILEHATRMLDSNTVGLVAEVWFCQVYENQALFHDLCALLETHGLRFYGFLSYFLRSGKRLEKRTHVGRERALYADAVFLRDPFDTPHQECMPRRAALLIAFAIINSYFDFALELAAAYGGRDRATLEDAIRDLARADVAAATDDLRQTSVIASTDPNEAMLAMGRFADRWRTSFDYTDVI